MNRRELMGTLGVGLATGLVLDGTARAADHHHDPEHSEHLELLAKCAKICNKVAHHCLEKLREGTEDHELHARIHQYTMDCQAFCVLTAGLVARKSTLKAYAHQACADACRDCAKVCDQAEDELIKECAEICRKCEKSCREMVKADRAQPVAR